jgi:DNA invertase Pin-like site-specific DNA recombinase
MLTITAPPDERLTPARRAKFAYIYVRQSSVTQVKHHQESTELQYRLVDRAVDLGWPRERVHVIDEDLGKSGAGHADRRGFQRLIAEIGLGNAGLVLSLDASRLARNNRDWHQLLELCSLFGVILADGERLYDPGAYHDRLLLGLSGIMSEAELHQIRMRLHQGELQKAARGELRMPLPAGLIHDRAGQIILNPDEEVQVRLRLVFAKFQELHSAHALSAPQRSVSSGSAAAWTFAARSGLARGQRRTCPVYSPEPGLRGRLCLWPPRDASVSTGRRPATGER